MLKARAANCNFMYLRVVAAWFENVRFNLFTINFYESYERLEKSRQTAAIDLDRPLKLKTKPKKIVDCEKCSGFFVCEKFLLCGPWSNLRHMHPTFMGCPLIV